MYRVVETFVGNGGSRISGHSYGCAAPSVSQYLYCNKIRFENRLNGVGFRGRLSDIMEYDDRGPGPFLRRRRAKLCRGRFRTVPQVWRVSGQNVEPVTLSDGRDLNLNGARNMQALPCETRGGMACRANRFADAGGHPKGRKAVMFEKGAVGGSKGSSGGRAAVRPDSGEKDAADMPRTAVKFIRLTVTIHGFLEGIASPEPRPSMRQRLPSNTVVRSQSVFLSECLEDLGPSATRTNQTFLSSSNVIWTISNESDRSRFTARPSISRRRA